MNIPDGYNQLPNGIRCRCVRLWVDGDKYYCCGAGSDQSIVYDVDGRMDAPNPYRQWHGRDETVDAVRHAFRNADAKDWEHLLRCIPDSGHGKFWKAVFEEVREALHDSKP